MLRRAHKAAGKWAGDLSAGRQIDNLNPLLAAIYSRPMPPPGSRFHQSV
jgi:hypothetical protein